MNVERVRFDALTQNLAQVRSRRVAIGLLASALGIGAMALPNAEAKKKKHKKKKKKKGKRCITVGDTQVTCAKGQVCCDPTRSTGPGCAPAGSPVCCVSTGFAYEADVVCCASSSEGSAGICDTSYPHCCPPGIYGCCEAGFPVCCSNGIGEYCCAAGMTCCDTDPTGCCAVGEAAPARAAGEAKRGTWLPKVRTAAAAAAYDQFG